MIASERGEVGLPAGMDTRIFETFARGEGSDRTGGSGLGLAIARSFADAMGLGIAACNRPEGGAEFSLRFPAPG